MVNFRLSLSKLRAERTIGSETKKVFLVIFAVLSIVGLFAILASLRGASTFNRIKAVQIPQFQSAENLKQEALDIIGIFYLLAGDNDMNLQMEQMGRYEELSKSFGQNLDAIKQSTSKMRDPSDAAAMLEHIEKTKSVFDSMNSNAREMTINNMENRRELGRKYFDLINKDIDTFKRLIGDIESLVNKDLNNSTDDALRLLQNSTYAGITVTILAIFITIALINYLMRFLSVSLLPISNLMHNLRQAVFSIDKDAKVVSPVSKYSEKVFNGNIVGADIFDLTFNFLGARTEAYSATKTAMTSVFGEDEMQWSLMEDNFPPLITIREPDMSDKTLKMSYTPLYDKSNIVQNIMIVAEDVTELERVKREANSKQAEVLIIQGLVGVDRGDLDSFLSDAFAGITKCYDLVGTIESDVESRKLLFRILHTIKGNSRLYNLTAISEAVHIAENSVVEISSRLDANERIGTEFYGRLTSGLLKVDEVLASYSKPAEQLFGIRNAGAPRMESFIHQNFMALDYLFSTSSSALFDPGEKDSLGLRSQFILCSVGSTPKMCAEACTLGAKYFGAQDLLASLERLTNKLQTDPTIDPNLFSPVRNLYLKFFSNHRYAKTPVASADDFTPLLAGLITISKATENLDFSALDDANTAKIESAIFEFFKASDSFSSIQLRFYAQRMCIALMEKSKANFESALTDAWHYTILIFHIDSSFRPNETVSEALSVLVGDFFKGQEISQLFDSVAEGSSLIADLFRIEQIAGESSRYLLNTIIGRGNVGSSKITIDVLHGAANSHSIFNNLYEMYCSSPASSINSDMIVQLLKDLESEFVRNWAISNLNSPATFIGLMNILASYQSDSSSESGDGVSQSYEVSAGWYESVAKLIEKLAKNAAPDMSKTAEDLFDTFSSAFDYPLISLCTKMSPMMRDLTKRLGKNINYLVSGDPAALPRDQAYALRDALVHMLRNALDHGIESPAERSVTNKPEIACINIMFEDLPDSIEVVVSDDGKGIGVEKVVAKAIQMKAITAEAAANLTESQKLDLIFLSRLSTKEEVSSLSGRGVGMDAVKAIIIERMGGSISLTSKEGNGTTFTLKIPKRKRKLVTTALQSEVASFLSNSLQAIEECVVLLNDIDKNSDSGKKIFQSLHTIKSTATMHNFKGLAEIVHVTESIVAEINTNAGLGKPTDVDLLRRLKSSIKNIHATIATQLDGHSTNSNTSKRTR